MMNMNTTNQIFSFFLAENQRPTAFQKELQIAMGIISQSMSATFGNITSNSPRVLVNGAGSGVRTRGFWAHGSPDYEFRPLSLAGALPAEPPRHNPPKPEQHVKTFARGDFSGGTAQSQGNQEAVFHNLRFGCLGRHSDDGAKVRLWRRLKSV